MSKSKGLTELTVRDVSVVAVTVEGSMNNGFIELSTIFHSMITFLK
jgi:hypothetical protein